MDESHDDDFTTSNNTKKFIKKTCQLEKMQPKPETEKIDPDQSLLAEMKVQPKSKHKKLKNPIEGETVKATPEKILERRERNRLRKMKSRSNETEEKRQERLKRERIAKSKARKLVSSHDVNLYHVQWTDVKIKTIQAELRRRELDRLRKREMKLKETPEQKAIRKEKDRLRKIRCRMNETPDQRQARLEWERVAKSKARLLNALKTRMSAMNEDETSELPETPVEQSTSQNCSLEEMTENETWQNEEIKQTCEMEFKSKNEHILHKWKENFDCNGSSDNTNENDKVIIIEVDPLAIACTKIES